MSFPWMLEPYPLFIAIDVGFYFENIVSALGEILTVEGVFLLVLGTMIGLVFGAMPGVGATVAMALMIPATFGLSPQQAMMVLTSILGGSAFGGSITAILLNIPGQAPSAATLLDGYPLTKQGQSNTAIGASATASAMGAIVGILFLVAAIPVIRSIIRIFGPPEFFAISLFGLLVVVIVGRGAILEGLIGGCIGLMISFIGFQQVTGGRRYTFESSYLLDGIHLVVALVGIFAIGEMIHLLSKNQSIATDSTNFGGSTVAGIKSVFQNFGLFMRSSLVGIVVGLIPAAGGAVSNFIAYGQAMQTSKNPEKFGTGDIRGVIASESANDSKDGGAAIPTLAFGIPGSTVWALILGAFIGHGILPGPRLMNQHLDIVFVILFSLLFSNILTSAIGVLIADKVSKITLVPPTILAPIVFLLALFGVYSLRFQILDIFVSVIFGVFAIICIIYGISRIAVVLGIILGPIIENSFHRSLQMGNGTYEMFYTRPVTVFILSLFVLALLTSVWKSMAD